MKGCENEDALLIVNYEVNNFDQKVELGCDLNLATAKTIINDKNGKPCQHQCEYMGVIKADTK